MVNQTWLMPDVAVPTAVFALEVHRGALPGAPGAWMGVPGLVLSYFSTEPVTGSPVVPASTSSHSVVHVIATEGGTQDCPASSHVR